MAKDTDNDAAEDAKQKAKGKKFAKGGKTNAQMLKLGRNRAKIANQKSSSRGK